MPTILYLGNFPTDIDPNERNYNSEDAGDLVGWTAGLGVLQLVDVADTMVGFGDNVFNDNDNPIRETEAINYDLGDGPVSTLTDSSVSLNVRVTDDLGAQQVIEVVGMQMTNGDLFISDLFNNGTLDNITFNNVEILSVTGSNYSGWFDQQSIDNGDVCFFARDLHFDANWFGRSRRSARRYESVYAR